MRKHSGNFTLWHAIFRQCSQEQIAPKNREQLYYILFGFKTIDQFSFKNDTFTLKWYMLAKVRSPLTIITL